MDDIKRTVANNISRLRNEKGLTQNELAEKLNYSDKSVSKWERGESLPDVGVLKSIADLFGVTLDYLASEHSPDEKTPVSHEEKTRFNRTLVTWISILLVWLVAAIVFVVFEFVSSEGAYFHYMAFIYALPASCIVWLVLNTLWFSRRRNYLIVSILMWTVLLSFFLSFSRVFDLSLIFILGAIGQVMILLWSMIKFK